MPSIVAVPTTCPPLAGDVEAGGSNVRVYRSMPLYDCTARFFAQTMAATNVAPKKRPHLNFTHFEKCEFEPATVPTIDSVGSACLCTVQYDSDFYIAAGASTIGQIRIGG